jgi:hypothetical protein
MQQASDARKGDATKRREIKKWKAQKYCPRFLLKQSVKENVFYYQEDDRS